MIRRGNARLDVVVWDTHPVQYRGPLYGLISLRTAGRIKVYYESDHSLQGYHDRQFGQAVKWDLPLLEGYRSEVLQPIGPARGAAALLRRLPVVAWRLWREQPRATLHVGFDTPAVLAAYIAAALLGLRQWLRVETQDAAFPRPRWKSALRRVAWSCAYAPFERAFYIGRLNREHLLAHGFRLQRVHAARYAVVDGIRDLPADRKHRERATIRERLGIPGDALVIGFCGKLIPKKDPMLLLNAAARMHAQVGRSVHVIMIGTGELAADLRARAATTEFPVHFLGFINQQALPAHYLAMDVFVLPSQQAGETWGLVVNEALHAGCAVAMSSAVGSSADFGGWKRCKVFEPGDAAGCADAILQLADFPRDFDWCAEDIRRYSMAAAAENIAATVIASTNEPPIV